MNYKLPSLAEATPEKAKPGRISRRVKRAIASMIAGETKTVTDAAAAVGLSREHLSRELSKPHVIEYLREKTWRALSIATARAGAVKIDNLESGNARVRDDASDFVLGLAGIRPAPNPTIAINIGVKAGYVIDLSDEPRPAPTVIEHEAGQAIAGIGGGTRRAREAATIEHDPGEAGTTSAAHEVPGDE